MSALPSPREISQFSPLFTQPFSFFSFASRFERATLRCWCGLRRFAAFQSNRARAFAAFGPPRTRLTRMPGQTFNLGYRTTRESDRLLPARLSLCETSGKSVAARLPFVFDVSRRLKKPWAKKNFAKKNIAIRVIDQERGSFLLIANMPCFFDGEIDFLHARCLNRQSNSPGTRVSACGDDASIM